MPETLPNSKIIENLKKEKANLEQEIKDMRTFFDTLTIVKMPLTVKGTAPIILECLVSKDIAEKIKEIIDAEIKKDEENKDDVSEDEVKSNEKLCAI